MVALCEHWSRMSIYRGTTVALLSLVIVTVATAGLGTHLYCRDPGVRVCFCVSVHVCVRAPPNVLQVELFV